MPATTTTKRKKLKTPYKDLLAPLSKEEREALQADIKVRGVLQPVIVDEDDNILDGHHRHELDNDAPTVVLTGLSDIEKQVFVLTSNDKRRNQSPDQKAEVRRRKVELCRELRKQDPKQWTEKRLAQLFGVSQPLIHEWLDTTNIRGDSSCIDARIKVGTEGKAEIVHRVLGLGESQRDVAADFYVTQQAVSKIVRQAERKAEAAARQAAVAAKASEIEGDAVDIRHTDCLQMIESLPDGSVSLLCTDPPYAVTDNDWDTFGSEQAFWDFMGSWLSAMRPKMAEQHTAFVFCDADKSPRLSFLLRDLGYDLLRQVIWYRPAIAKKRSGSLTFLSSYEPFWHCGNRSLAFPAEWGDERFDVQTFAAPQSNHVKDQSFHPTQKPLALIERLVQMGSDAGELVVDPFCGSGTTAVACAKNARRCVTSDLNEEYIAIAKGRVASVL
jgi:site-specific DNA-methyltransferase (adenine-specific)